MTLTHKCLGTNGAAPAQHMYNFIFLLTCEGECALCPLFSRPQLVSMPPAARHRALPMQCEPAQVLRVYDAHIRNRRTAVVFLCPHSPSWIAPTMSSWGRASHPPRVQSTAAAVAAYCPVAA